MRIAVMSDSHDNLQNLEEAVAALGGQKVDALIHCGDLCSPFVMERLALFKGRVHIVFGNNDGDPYMIMKMARNHRNIDIHGHTGYLDTGKGLIAFTHYPETGRGLASSGKYTAVFSGHTHMNRTEEISGTVHVNPGEIMGLKENPGFVVFDAGSVSMERVEL
jgi:putative phosphoesterase